jgi:EipB-like
MHATRLALVLLASSTFAFPGAASAARMLAPHRAVYDLALDKASDRSGITGITGRMVYEFNGSACDGYTVTFRFVTRINTNDTTRVTDQQTTTFEDADGKSFSFVTKSYVDQSLDKEVKGTATREPAGVKVELEKPEPQSLDVGTTLFPTQQLIEMLDKANVGDTFYETSLFDGSEDADRRRSPASTRRRSGRSTSPISTRRRRAAKNCRNIASASSCTTTASRATS